MSLDPLPVDEISGPLLRALRSAQAVVVEAPPGSGTTAALAGALLDAGWSAEREIWVAEPRRASALLAADLVAHQLGESVGQRVGYQARFEQQGGLETRLSFVTDGVLLERLSSSERGTGIGLVVLDEFHERRLASELCLMLSRRRLAADAGLRVIVLSATQDVAAAVAAYLGGCPRLRCSERALPAPSEPAAGSARRPEAAEPELRRLDLSGALLTLYACKVPLTPGLWLDAPSDAALDGARALLEQLGLASGDRLTDLGRRASVLPVHPRLARVALEGAELGIPRRVCLAVALLAERDIRQDPSESVRGVERLGRDCDLELRMGLYTAAEAQGFAPAALHQLGLHFERVERVGRCFEQLLGNLTARQPAADEHTLGDEDARRALGLALLAGFPDRLAGRCEPGQHELILSTGRLAQLAPESLARTSPHLLAVDLEELSAPDDGKGPGPLLRVRLASPIEAQWLIEHAAEGCSGRELLNWENEREQAILISQRCWGEVVLQQSVRPAYPGIATGVLVERAALDQLDTLFRKTESLPELVARSELVAEVLPEIGLQKVTELGTRGLLHAACARVISLAELRELDWGSVFLEQLSPEQRRELESQAPEYVVLKGGRRVRVMYARGQAPFIQARLQDFFGMPEGPALVSGRVPLRLHLLAPNQRAVQVTADLAEFWQRHYPGLRRELSRQYPLDAWPEEPRTATAPTLPRG